MGAALLFIFLIYFGVIFLMVASMWKINTKAGKPGWACLIPIYSTIVLLEIIGKPIWWLVLIFIPIVNFVILIIMFVELAKSFGKSGGYAAGLLLLPIIFFPMLAFGDAVYVGPGGNPVAQPTAA